MARLPFKKKNKSGGFDYTEMVWAKNNQLGNLTPDF
jgi:hypothetical protein